MESFPPWLGYVSTIIRRLRRLRRRHEPYRISFFDDNYRPAIVCSRLVYCSGRPDAGVWVGIGRRRSGCWLGRVSVYGHPQYVCGYRFYPTTRNYTTHCALRVSCLSHSFCLATRTRSEEHTSELQSRENLV